MTTHSSPTNASHEARTTTLRPRMARRLLATAAVTALVVGLGACAEKPSAPPPTATLGSVLDERGAALVGRSLWVAKADSTITRIDVPAMQVQRQSTRQVGWAIQHQVMYAGGSLWVTDSTPRGPSEGMADPPEPRTLLRLDPATGAVQHRWTIDGSDEYRGFAEGGGSVWISRAKRRGIGIVERIDLAANRLTTHQTTGLMPQPLLWAGDHLWVGHGQPTLSIPSWSAGLPPSHRPTVVRMDAAGRVVSRTEIGSDMDAGGVTSLVRVGDKVLAATATGAWLAELDLSGRLLRQSRMPFGCDAPVLYAAGRLWRAGASCTLNSNAAMWHSGVWVADPKTLRLQAVVPTAGRPRGVVVDDTSLWVSSTDLMHGDGEGTTTRYALSDLHEVERFTYGGGWLISDGRGGVYAGDVDAGTVRHLRPSS